MTLLDRFRTPTPDKSPDPLVRLAYVEELPLSDSATIAAIARDDEDARVRKAAVAKLMRPAVLATIAREEREESVKAQALTMLRDIAFEAFEEVTEADSVAAVGHLTDTRTLAQIAKSATKETIALKALARIDDGRTLGSVARHGASEAARMHAATRLRDAGDHAELLAIALNSDFKDTALLALEPLTDRTTLDQIIARGKNKSAVKRARAIVREAEEQAAREAAEAAAMEALVRATEEPLVESTSEAVTPPQGDPLTPEIVPDPAADEARARDAAAAAEQQALAEAQARDAAAAERERRQARLTELLDQTATAPPDEPFAEARTRVQRLRREWRELTTGVDADPALAERFAAIDAAMHERERENQEADARARRDGLHRLQQLLQRLEPLPANPELTLKAGERALRDLRTALSAMPQLPTKQDAEEITRRLKDAQAALTPKVQELREADDWRRFSNVTVQEQLCARMEALETAENPEAIVREVRALQEQWRAAAEVPRAQADALWRRFKTAHDKVWARCEAHFAAENQARGENLTRKIALCEQAEALADSSNWIQTADAIKALQAEWKQIGPVSRGKEKAIWDRFRTACDKFFTRRHDDLASRKAAWSDNLAKKDALCVRAEALATSTDWDQAAQELKQLQAEWKTIGPVKKTKSEAIWQRFRGASDAFFARYSARHDTARLERIAAREAVCAEVEALAVPEEAAANLPETLRGLRNKWQQLIAARGVDPENARQLDQRWSAATAALIARWPQAFAGTEMDPEANRKRMEALVKKVEDLAASSAGPAVDQALSPTNRLAAMLKEALAANTIGGKADDDSRARAVAEDVRQAQAAWAKLGPVAEDARRPLSDRFHRAIRRLSERTAPAGQRGGASSVSSKSRK